MPKAFAAAALLPCLATAAFTSALSIDGGLPLNGLSLPFAKSTSNIDLPAPSVRGIWEDITSSEMLTPTVAAVRRTSKAGIGQGRSRSWLACRCHCASLTC